MLIYKILLRFFPVLLSDKAIINIKYKLVFHRKLNLKHPETFNEKLHWLRFYGYQKLYCTLADKYTVREYVKEKIGEKYLIPLIQVYNDPATIDFNQLPSSFVFKLAYGSGWNIICTNKNKLNIKKCIQQLKTWQKSDYYRLGREKQYKGIPPRILCEQFIGEKEEVPEDYKFFCFDGQPHFIQVDISRFKNHRRIIYDTKWNRLPIKYCFSNEVEDIPCPDNLQEMLEIAQKLSAGQSFVRVDLYSVNHRIYFGELTLTPGNGFEVFTPQEIDKEWGEFIKIN